MQAENFLSELEFFEGFPDFRFYSINLNNNLKTIALIQRSYFSVYGKDYFVVSAIPTEDTSPVFDLLVSKEFDSEESAEKFITTFLHRRAANCAESKDWLQEFEKLSDGEINE